MALGRHQHRPVVPLLAYFTGFSAEESSELGFEAVVVVFLVGVGLAVWLGLVGVAVFTVADQCLCVGVCLGFCFRGGFVHFEYVRP